MRFHGTKQTKSCNSISQYSLIEHWDPYMKLAENNQYGCHFNSKIAELRNKFLLCLNITKCIVRIELENVIIWLLKNPS